MKNPLTPAGNEPATFRIVAQLCYCGRILVRSYRKWTQLSSKSTKGMFNRLIRYTAINEFDIFPSVHSGCNLCAPIYAHKLYKVISYPVYSTFLHRIHQYARVTGIWTFWIENIDIRCFYKCIQHIVNNNISDVWLTVHRNSVWIRKTNQMSLFVFFISLLIVAQHVSGNHVLIIRS